MKRGILVILFSLICFSLIGLSCSPKQSEGYLSVGQTQRNGDFSETIVRLDYVASYSSDKNKVAFELEFSLHSYRDFITSLNIGHSAVFDGNTNNGRVTATMKYPSSIAPGDDETVIIKLECFKDWKTAKITYSHYSDSTTQYSFSIKSDDFPSKLNNVYPTLKSGQNFSTSDGKLTITMNSLEKTTIGSAYAGSNSNLMLKYAITNNTSEVVSNPQYTSSYSINVAEDDASAHFSISTSTQPDRINPNNYITMELIIVVSPNWIKMTISCGTSYAFNVLHSDFASVVD